MGTEKDFIDVEVLDKEDETKALVKRKEEPQIKTQTNFSTLPFYNKIQEWGLKSYRKVIQEETGLFNDLVGHQKALDRLTDVDVEIAAEREERRLRLLEAGNALKQAQRNYVLSKEDDEIARLERKLRRRELEKNISDLENPPSPEEKKDPLERLREDERGKAKKAAIKSFGEFEKRDAIIEEYERRRRAILKGRRLSELTKEELDALEDLEDLKDHEIKKL